MAETDVVPEIDWSETGSSRVPVASVLAVLGAVAVGGAFGYSYLVVGKGNPVFGYPVGRLDWLWLVSLWLTLVYGVVPAIGRPAAAVNVYRRLRRRPIGLAAGAITLAIFLVGTFGPVVLGRPTPHFLITNQPPVYTSISASLPHTCTHVVGDRCYGTWAHPLGTTDSGKDVLALLVLGTRTVVEMSMVSVMLIVPVATAVGTVSAYLGGRTDRLLTGIYETFKTIPALLVFLLWRWLTGDGTLFMLVVAFGLFNWGTVADVVRSRALTEVSKNYVRAAEGNGASTGQVIRWHLLPNIARTAFTTAIYQIPLFVTVEASLAFLRFGRPSSSLLLVPTTFVAWGHMIGDNIQSFDPYWWRSTLPVVALIVTILAVSVFAHAIQDVLDPRVD